LQLGSPCLPAWQQIQSGGRPSVARLDAAFCSSQINSRAEPGAKIGIAA
jgi:hypothetical protein